MDNFESFKVIKRVQDTQDKYKLIDLKESRISNPTLLCLGGNATKYENIANSYCDLVEGLIGLYPQIDNEQATVQDIDILGVVYGDRNSVFAIEEFANNLLLPLLVDDNGNAFSIEEAKRNFNKLTVFCHCYGTVVLSGMVIYLKDLMENKYGFSEQDATDILTQISCVAYAPYNPVSLVPTLDIKTFEDDVVIDWTRCPFSRKYINGVKFYRMNNNVLTLWSSKLANAHREVEYPLISNLLQNADKFVAFNNMHNEHSPRIINRNARWQLESRTDKKFYAGANADAVSQVVGYALASSLASSIRNTYEKGFVPKPTLDEIERAGISIISAFDPEDLKCM